LELAEEILPIIALGPCHKMPLGFRLSCLCLAWLILLLFTLPGRGQGLRCYVCGGNSGVTCSGSSRDDEDEGVRDGVVLQDPVQECNDLINNRGCVKQYVSGVVLLRGCWLDGTNKCLRNGAAEVCTCSTDLCNGGSPIRPFIGTYWSLLISLIILIIQKLNDL